MKRFYAFFVMCLAFSSWIYVVDAQNGDQMNIDEALSTRTTQVQDAIVAAAGVDSIDDVTDMHLANIGSLLLGFKNIDALKVGDFDGLTALTTLELQGNSLSTLPVGIFDGPTKLKTLNLLYNSLSTLPVGIFDGLTTLESLDLYHNSLSTLHEDLFDDLTALKTLDLNVNSLASLPKALFEGPTALEELILTRNPLSTLPVSIFKGLTALQELWLYENSLDSLPVGIFEGLTSVTYLSLRNNDLDSLPDGIFDGLTALETLNLAGNNLSSLSDDIFDKLTTLETLDLNENVLGVLSGGEFDGLTQLKSLLLNDNNLSTLPDGIFEGLTELGTLTLYGNQVDPLLLTVSLKEVEAGEFKATVPTGAPFDIVLPLSVENGSISGGATSVTISTGSIESESLTVTHTAGTTNAVTVDIGDPLPDPPFFWHNGYKLVKSGDLSLEIIRADGGTDVSGGAPPSVNNHTPQAPDETALFSNYPNPFNPETWIPYHLSNPSQVVITIYDTRGSVIRRLDLGHQREGYYTSRSRAAYWDGRNDMGERVASGMYFYQLEADNISLLRKMVILK